MVMISLDRTWVNLVSTGASVSAYTGRGRSRQYQQTGAVQQFAGGRFRAISTEGIGGSQTFTLRDVNDADLETLKSWIGQAVLVRDNRGRKMYGTFFVTGWSDRMAEGYYDISIQLSEITVNEGA